MLSSYYMIVINDILDHFRKIQDILRIIMLFILREIERDANASYESSEVKKMKQEALISKMRRENKQKRIELARTKRVSTCPQY